MALSQPQTPFLVLPNPLGVTSDQFVAAAAGHVVVDGDCQSPPLGGSPGALELYRRLYRDGPAVFAQTRVRPGVAALRGAGPNAWWLPQVISEHREQTPDGVVIKFLTRIPATTHANDHLPLSPSSTALAQQLTHLEVESVLIPMVGSTGTTSYTLCVSSQVGCAMGCTFCETAQMGLIRSLAPHEIVAQWWAATHLVTRDDDVSAATLRARTRGASDKFLVKNIVFMGMGEPMDNLPNVIRAIDILRGHNGPHIPTSNITVSTVGRVDGIQQLARQVEQEGWHRLGIALSLNAPNDEARSQIMPITRRYNLASVQQALLAWPKFAGNKICVEYVLIPGQNDAIQHAREIAEFIRPFGLHKAARAGEPMRAVLNLIPYNPRRNSPWPAPTEAQIEQFMAWLVELGVFVKRRRTKGRRMMGACGQLGNQHIRKRQLVAPTISAAPGPSTPASSVVSVSSTPPTPVH